MNVIGPAGADRTEREKARLAALHEYGVLDAPADDELSAVVRAAAMVAGVPTATLNLIDEDRQCQLTTTGFVGADSDRSDSMCAIRFQSGQFIHVPDASLDGTYAANPWVTGVLADVRFYASAPLITPEGHALGSLCVFHSEPHRLTDEQIARLKDLARVILALFERRRQARVNAQLAAAERAQRRALSDAHAELAQRGRQLVATVAELQRSNTELAQFASIVSHDLMAPLAVVDGYLELLGDTYRDTLPRDGRHWIDTAHRAVHRMRDLVQALLSYAQAGNATYLCRPADLDDLVRHVLDDLHSAITDAAATVTIPARLPIVSCDPTLVRQLLQNLVGNAVKYRHPHRPCHITVTAAPDPPEQARWRVAVTDNGVGIPAEHRQHVFDMFTRLRSEDRDGYGIGLSTCHRIVTRHGGEISCHDAPGGGTMIAFTIPAADSPADLETLAGESDAGRTGYGSRPVGGPSRGR